VRTNDFEYFEERKRAQAFAALDVGDYRWYRHRLGGRVAWSSRDSKDGR
jgi:hypothetical protein